MKRLTTVTLALVLYCFSLFSEELMNRSSLQFDNFRLKDTTISFQSFDSLLFYCAHHPFIAEGRRFSFGGPEKTPLIINREEHTLNIYYYFITSHHFSSGSSYELDTLLFQVTIDVHNNCIVVKDLNPDNILNLKKEYVRRRNLKGFSSDFIYMNTIADTILIRAIAESDVVPFDNLGDRELWSKKNPVLFKRIYHFNKDFWDTLEVVQKRGEKQQWETLLNAMGNETIAIDKERIGDYREFQIIRTINMKYLNSASSRITLSLVKPFQTVDFKKSGKYTSGLSVNQVEWLKDTAGNNYYKTRYMAPQFDVTLLAKDASLTIKKRKKTVNAVDSVIIKPFRGGNARLYQPKDMKKLLGEEDSVGLYAKRTLNSAFEEYGATVSELYRKYLEEQVQGSSGYNSRRDYFNVEIALTGKGNVASCQIKSYETQFPDFVKLLEKEILTWSFEPVKKSSSDVVAVYNHTFRFRARY